MKQNKKSDLFEKGNNELTTSTNTNTNNNIIINDFDININLGEKNYFQMI